jgi:hypothetical protein
MYFLNSPTLVIAATYPFIEKIKFDTEVIELNSLKQAAVGSLSRFDTFINMPSPSYSIMESITRDIIVSGNDNLREQRKPRYEASLRRYKLHFDAISYTQADALKYFFIARKGRYNNFYIQKTENSPYTSYSLFEGNLTVVNFDSDVLTISMNGPGRFFADIPIVESYNSIRIPKQLNPIREFTINYAIENLSTLIDFFENHAVGKNEVFTFNPYSMVSHYLDNTNYIVRFDIDSFEREIRQINEDTVSVVLKEVVA